jgi:hydrogenase maturation protein HypF
LKIKMRTFHIHIEGQVQGVGFRPFVYRLATSLGIQGTVSNGLDGVHVFFNGEKTQARHFYQKLIHEIPQRARLLRHRMEEQDWAQFIDFQIVESHTSGRANLLITPDLGLCDDCRRELHDAADHRFHYPFITCINCGPRYSILHSLPYDRERSSMAPFKMCPACQTEYGSPLTRRHFSQTNSCPDCAVELSFWQKKSGRFEKTTSRTNDGISLTIKSLARGQIIAVKGIGGYLLICDATNPTAVATLRERKKRPSKPLALMYPSLAILKKDAYLNKTEAAAFTSIESPIVLCQVREQPASGIDTNGICPQLGRIGAMQPYTPLMELILAKWQKPIVATSGNLSGAPIFFEDEKALENLGTFVDAFLVHNREILLPQDDSVVQFTPVNHQRIVLRRSRGYAPTYIHPGFENQAETVLAMGADMKSTFSLQHAGNTYISQYLGDLGSYDTQENFDKTLRHLLRLFGARPERVVVDLHPAYFSSLKGRDIAKAAGSPVVAVQHHIAHFAAVLAENELLTSNEPVLGVIWDGTGWGDPAPQNPPEIWGGEFFLFENPQFERVAHLDYFPHLLGDKMAKEPRLSALALCRGIPGAEAFLRPLFSQKEWIFYQKMVAKAGGPATSSMGRLFDGVAALLGLQATSSFEGEAAMQLEALAQKASKAKAGYENLSGLNIGLLMTNIVADLQSGASKPDIAFKFHRSLVQWIQEMAAAQGVRKLAFSGGVFQNALLVDLIISELGENYQLFFHKELSPNDECISFGQLALSLAPKRQAILQMPKQMPDLVPF